MTNPSRPDRIGVAVIGYAFMGAAHTAMASGHDPKQSFVDSLRMRRVLAPVEAGAVAESAWTAVGERR